MGSLHVYRWGIYRKSLYLSLNFIVNLNLFIKKKVLFCFVFVNKKNLVAKERRSVQEGTNGNSILDREIISLYFFRKNIDL